MNIIRKVIRSLPETNSSSSHSLVISDEFLKCKFEGTLWKSYVEGDVLEMETREFGIELLKTNDPYIKLQYVYGLANCKYGYRPEELTSGYQVIERIVKEFTGIKEIRYKWFEEFYNDLESYRTDPENDYFENYPLTPSIDHQSTDLVDDVFESEDTLKNFIFSENSWLFTASDGSDLGPKYMNVQGRDISSEGGYLTVHVGEDIGDINLPYTGDFLEDPRKLDNLGYSFEGERIVCNIAFEKDTLKRTNKYGPDNLNFRGICSLKNKEMLWATSEWVDTLSHKFPENTPKYDLSWEELEVYIDEVEKELPGQCKKIKFEIYSNEYGNV